MTAPTRTGLLLCALGLAACGGRRSVEIDPEGAAVNTRWNSTLATPAQLAGAMQVKGSAWMGPDGDDSSRTEAWVAIENAVPGGKHPWHVHLGQCGSDRGILGPPDSYEPLEVKNNGKADSKAEIPVPVPASGQYFVNVHASANNMRTIIACGNLASPSR